MSTVEASRAPWMTWPAGPFWATRRVTSPEPSVALQTLPVLDSNPLTLTNVAMGIW